MEMEVSTKPKRRPEPARPVAGSFKVVKQPKIAEEDERAPEEHTSLYISKTPSMQHLRRFETPNAVSLSHRSFAPSMRSPSADKVMSKQSYMKSVSKIVSRNQERSMLSASTLGDGGYLGPQKGAKH